jgi:uncharacterized protein (TIGR00369 family)
MRLAALLTMVERTAPALAPRVKRWFVERAVPLNRAIGLRIGEVAPDSSRVVLRLPPRRRNTNAGGTIHGGVITALAETAHGVAVLWQFPPATHLMVSRELRVEFVAPARGELRVEFSLDEAMRRGIEEGLAARGSLDFQLVSEVKDAGGRTVARLTGSYVIRRIDRRRPPRMASAISSKGSPVAPSPTD